MPDRVTGKTRVGTRGIRSQPVLGVVRESAQLTYRHFGLLLATSAIPQVFILACAFVLEGSDQLQSFRVGLLAPADFVSERISGGLLSDYLAWRLFSIWPLVLGLGAVAVAVAWLCTALQFGATTYAAGHAYITTRPSLAQCYAAAFSRLGRLAAANVVWSAPLLLLQSLVLVTANSGASNRGPLASLGLCLGGVVLIGVLTYLSIRWILVSPAIMLDDATLIGAFAASSRLVAGRWWRTAIVTLIPACVVIVAVLALAGLLGALIPQSGLLSRALGGIDGNPSRVPGTLAGLLVAPISYASLAVVFYDLKARAASNESDDELVDVSVRISRPRRPRRRLGT